VAGVTPSPVEQLALADLIVRGELDRHLRRMRVRYAARRELLIGRLGAALPDAVIGGIAAGLFVPVPVESLPAPSTPAMLLGVGEPADPYLLLGFAGADDAEMERGVASLRRTAPPESGDEDLRP
jgi:GntR family transcriptional regulator/MocR family aminotransferase